MSETDFDTWAAARYRGLLHLGYLLTGDPHLAQDLVQTALAKTHVHWRRVHASPDAYVRRVMATTRADWWRRQVWREESTDSLPESSDHVDERLDLRDALLRALRGLPPAQRRVVVLRHYLQMSEAECAELLGCSLGTVKSATSRALARLRESPALATIQESTR